MCECMNKCGVCLCVQCNRPTWVHTSIVQTVCAQFGCIFQFKMNGMYFCYVDHLPTCCGNDSNGIHNWNYVCASRHWAHLNFRLKLVLCGRTTFKWVTSLSHSVQQLLLPRIHSHTHTRARWVWFDDGGYRPLGMLIYHLRLKQIIYTSLLCNSFRCVAV